MATQQPNVLVIMTDQHNPHIAGFAGNAAVSTPNLDRLASKSTVFRAAYCQYPLCTPSRMSLLTGKLSQRVGGWVNRSQLFPEHATLAGELASAGYTTCYVGKMHITGPNRQHGFAYWPYGDIESGTAGHQPDPLHTVDGKWSNHKVGRFPWAGPTQIPESLLQDRVVTRESLSFALEHADQHPQKPWFLFTSYSRPHFPLTTPGRYFRKYLRQGVPMPPLPEGYPDRLHPHDRRTIEEFSLLEFDEETHHRGLAAYYACVEFVDECMGELLNGLERAGLLENTVIVYVSDHGDMAREHGLWWKRTYYDASVGVPLMVSLPGQEARQDVSVPVELVDLFPTILALCGRDLPEDIDGESLLPLLAEGDLAPARQKRLARSVFMDGRENMAFRMVRTERHKYVSFLKAEPVLYDLVEDPGELHNKAADPKLQDVVRELERLLDASGTWAEIVERFGADDQRSLRPNRSWAGSPNQFQLYDGRVAHVDARLYEKAP